MAMSYKVTGRRVCVKSLLGRFYMPDDLDQLQSDTEGTKCWLPRSIGIVGGILKGPRPLRS